MTHTVTHRTMYVPPTLTTITPPPEESLALHPGLENCPPATNHTPVATQPDTPTTGSSKRQRQRRRPWMYRQKYNAQQQQPTALASFVFSPRPYESLYAERAYLSNSLQIQSDQAIILMQQYAAVESKIQWLGGGKERRRLKKQLDLLRHKINHTVEQEKIILARLGELYVETQSHEFRSQASYERRSSVGSSVMSSPLMCGGMLPMSPMLFGLPPLITSFSGGPAELVQSGYGGDFIASPESSICYQDSLQFAGDLETVDEIGEDGLCEIDSASESQGLDMGPATPGVSESSAIDDVECRVEGDGLQDAYFEVVQKRRLSLPCLHTVWPEI